MSHTLIGGSKPMQFLAWALYGHSPDGTFTTWRWFRDDNKKPPIFADGRRSGFQSNNVYATATDP